jgi:DNA-binding CsgD family transcriptional regulator
MEYVGGLVGRAAEIAALESALELRGRQAGAAVLLSGEPGIGKTALLAHGARVAAGRGHLVLEGRASELERDVPFGVFIDALDDYLASLNAHALGDLAAEQHQQVAAVFPALDDAGSGGGPSLPQERYRTYRAIRALLAILAAPHPLVLALDDLHWTDEASLELLDHLLRHPPPGPSLLLLAQRGREPVPLLGAGRAERVHIELEPLPRQAAELMLEGVHDAELREWMYLESGGNPFYLEQLARSAARGTLVRTSGGENPLRPGALKPGAEGDLSAIVPLVVSEALAEELHALPEDSQLVLRAAALAGEPFGPELVSGIAQLGKEQVLTSFDRALSAGLICATDSPLWFRFRHPIVRRATYLSAGAGWRIGAHARAAELLAAQGASPAVRAHHVRRSAAKGDLDAIQLLALAGHSSLALAPATAVAWFDAAISLLPDDAAAESRLALLGPRATALGAAGRLQEARDALAQLYGLLDPAHTYSRGRILGFTAMIDRLLGRPDEAWALLRSSSQALAQPDSSDGAELQLELASDRFFAGDWQAMHEAAQRCWNSAAGTADDGLKGTAAGMLGLAEYSIGRVPQARDRMLEARSFLDAARDAREGRLDAYDWLGWLELSVEEHAPAIDHFTLGLELGRRTGAGHLLITMSFGLVLGCAWSGRLNDSVEHSDNTLQLARFSGSDRLIAWAAGLRTLVELRTGALERAIASGLQALGFEHALSASPFSAINAAWLGEAWIEAGQPERGRDQILRALGGPGLPMVESAYRPYFYDVLTGADIALHRLDEAAEWARCAGATASGLGLPGRTGAALHAHGLVALAHGSADDAASAACEAADLLALAHPIESARARILAGRSLVAAGQRERGLAELHRAAAESAALGAHRNAAQAVRELRRLGERIGRGGQRGRATTGLQSLSGREREVVELVTARLTNREIAERLVLSEKTVERHLSRIFVKLDAHSRVEVARIAEGSRHLGTSLRGPVLDSGRGPDAQSRRRDPVPAWSPHHS